jgi:hypothetical protein
MCAATLTLCNAACTGTTSPKQQRTLADLVIATKGDGTAWNSGFDVTTQDACAAMDAAYITCVPSSANAAICDVE